MTRTYPDDTLGSLLFNHNNDYGFDDSVMNNQIDSFPSLTVAIPYFEAKSTINLTLKYLIESVKEIKQIQKNWHAEIIVIDDGSVDYPAKITIKPEYISQIRLIALPKNQGRFAARNTGIREARYDFMIFSDADILINGRILQSHLSAYAAISKQNKNAITASIFNFINLDQVSGNMSSFFSKSNDFRIDCTYQESWIGCEEDRQFAGKNYHLLRQTDNFRDWPKSGMLGPWALSNMVLGGIFGFSAKLAKKVGGCDKLFSDYGFEETSLATKLIALCNAYVVPISSSYAIHVSDSESTLPQSEKDSFFQKAHALYFEKYLHYDKKQAIQEKI